MLQHAKLKLAKTELDKFEFDGEYMDNKNVKICDECQSEFLASSSKMMGLCPESASALYGYENCKHIFKQGRCVKCLWNGNKSEYVRWLQKI